MGSQVVWVVFFALLSETVHGGPAEPSVGEMVTAISLIFLNPTDGCTDGDVRPVSGTRRDGRLATGDIAGSIEICENQLWKKVVLCLHHEQWTMETTAVACRELGYTAGGQGGLDRANKYARVTSD